MSRPLRIEYASAIYHVMSRGRGNAGAEIVGDDRVREQRLYGVGRTVDEHGWRLHACVLMTNHEHLFVETPQPNLSRGMKLLNGAYTQFFNGRRRRRGHLFQDRYKAHLVEDQGFWSELSRYVHLNPVRAGMVKDPLEYPWSSFPGYCRASRRLDWVTYDRVLADHGSGDVALRRRRYAKYVRQAIELPLRAPWETAWHGLVLGTEAFLEKVRQRLALAEADPEITGSRHMLQRPPVDKAIEHLAEALGADPSSWSWGRRIDSGHRATAAYAARRLLGYRRGEVARALGYRSPRSVAQTECRVEASGHLRRLARKAAAQMASS